MDLYGKTRTLRHEMEANVSNRADPGRKTARMEQRTTQQAKDLIEQAAGLLGINASDFVVSVASRAARETLRDYEQTRLTTPAHNAFLQALEATEPSDKFVELMRLHKEVSSRK